MAHSANNQQACFGNSAPPPPTLPSLYLLWINTNTAPSYLKPSREAKNVQQSCACSSRQLLINSGKNNGIQFKIQCSERFKKTSSR